MRFLACGRAGRAIFLAGVVATLVVVTGCNRVLGREYEYEEDTTLSLDGSAIVYINTSIAALVALRGFDLNPDTRARFDQAFVANVRRQAEAGGCVIDSVSTTSWYRSGRRFLQLRVRVPDIRHAATCSLLSWSKYAYTDDGKEIALRQDLGPSSGKDVAGVNWDGSEFVAFKLHLPSKITFHNVRDLDSGLVTPPKRGNILVWEQRLSDRRAGKPLSMEMRMERESILRRTMMLFAAAFVAAVAVMGGAIWWTLKRPRRRA
jgi:hypothetical protein